MSRPVNVFGRSRDLAALTYQFLGALPDARVAIDGATSQIDTVLANSTALTVQVSLDHLDEGQRRGLREWLAKLTPTGDEHPADEVDDLAVSIAFVLGAGAQQDDVDRTVELALDAAEWADGFVVALEAGLVLGPDGSIRAEAPTPEPPAAAVDEPVGDDLVAEARRLLDDGLTDGVVVGTDLIPEPQPPSVLEVGRRLIATAAVAARGLTELDGTHLESARTGLTGWVESTEAAVHLEPWEVRVLTAPPGELADADRLTAAWRTEGAGVLAWVLGLLDRPDPDELSDPSTVFDSIGLPDPHRTATILQNATLRPTGAITAWRDQLIEQNRALRSAVDDPAAVIALERLRAINWLRDGGSFEDTDVSIRPVDGTEP